MTNSLRRAWSAAGLAADPVLWAAFKQTRFAADPARRTLIHLGLASLVCFVGIYFNTGTLAPYSAVKQPFELLGCGYTTNGDHINFLQTHWMLWGWPEHSWSSSVYLRRVLHPIIASPLVLLFGFAIGGILTNIVLALGALALWCWVIFTNFGRRAAVITVWVLATSPGIAYWAGLPYHHGAIIPGSVVAAWALFFLYRSPDLPRALLAGLAIGMVSQAYEIAPLFAPAGLLLIVLRRKFQPVIPFVLGLAVPFLITHFLLTLVFHTGASSSNTSVYGEIIKAYMGIFTGGIDYGRWLLHFRDAPYILLSNLLNATFWLPVFLLLAVKLLALRHGLGLRFHAVSTAMFLSMLAVFAINNLAPDYEGWPMRGVWIARLYQPVLIPILVEIASVSLALSKKLAGSPAGLGLIKWPTAAACTIQFAIIASGLMNVPQLGQFFYEGFYMHAPHGTYVKHIATYGRRPLGFCVRGSKQTWPKMNRAKK